jgi:hypothetical protein
MKYLDGYLLSNDEDDDAKKLTNTDGSYESQETGVYSEYHEEYIDEDDAVMVDYMRPTGRRIHSWVRYDDCVYTIDNEYRLTDDCVKVSGEWYLEDDERLITDYDGDTRVQSECVWSERMEEWIMEEDSCKLGDGTYILDGDAFECNHDGLLYHIDEAVTIEGLKVYEGNQEAYRESLTISI